MPITDNTIMIVDDEPIVVQALTSTLQHFGFRVVTAKTGQEALEKLRQAQPSLIILDIIMPDLDGFEILRRIRQKMAVPVIFCSGRHDEVDRIRGLDMGADDYVTKPFSPRELVSRVTAVLRRVKPEPSTAKSELKGADDDLRIDFEQSKVTVRGQEIALGPTEQRLLYELVTHSGKLLTNEFLLSKVWGPNHGGDEVYVRVYVTRLRQKLEKDPENPKYILGDRSGYRFKALVPTPQPPRFCPA